MIFIGGLNSAVAHPRNLPGGRYGFRRRASSLAINHPSGNPEPSQADIDFTRRLMECGELMGIELLDHFVVGGEEYISLKEFGAFKKASKECEKLNFRKDENRLFSIFTKNNIEN